MTTGLPQDAYPPASTAKAPPGNWAVGPERARLHNTLCGVTKLSVVVSDICGASGRDMLAAPVAGERNPKVLAQLARHTMRKKITVLELDRLPAM
jgi:hypothetical protein